MHRPLRRRRLLQRPAQSAQAVQRVATRAIVRRCSTNGARTRSYGWTVRREQARLRWSRVTWKADGFAALWYHVDGGDADPATFFYLLSGPRRKPGAPGQAHKPLPLLTPGVSQRSHRLQPPLLPRALRAPASALPCWCSTTMMKVLGEIAFHASAGRFGAGNSRGHQRHDREPERASQPVHPAHREQDRDARRLGRAAADTGRDARHCVRHASTWMQR